MTRHLVWFRQDLRVYDNTALWNACLDPEADVIALFCATPQQWRLHDMAPVRERFIWRNLAALKASLSELNIPLVVKQFQTFDDCEQAVPALCDELGVTDLFANCEYPVNEQKRDRV
ncbi:MAG: deoxyribodipyrimidine photo-lyase, partial [Halieaceae bacterium]|nr:deoxyribodipyrimidine photo-lyase [Halieaceae bacterium]